MNKKLTSKEMWEQEIRPMIVEDIYVHCQTDTVLLDKLMALVNHVDQDIRNGVFFDERLMPFVKVLNTDSYYENSAIRKAKESERTKVRDLAQALNVLLGVVRSERRYAPVEEEQETPSKKRLPNRDFDVKEMYEPIQK